MILSTTNSTYSRQYDLTLERAAGDNDEAACGVAVTFIIAASEVMRSESTERGVDLVYVGQLTGIDVGAI